MSAETDRELRELKQQVAQLRQESAATRTGSLKWMRATGMLLLVYAVGIFLGVLKAHVKAESNPVVGMFVFGAIFMGCFGLWYLAWSFRWLAEKLMKTA